MTPEELNRTIEFLIKQSAEISVRQDRDHEVMARSLARFEAQAEKDRRLLAELLAIQSSRLDRAEREDRAAQKRHEEFQKRNDDSQKRNDEFQKEALRMLHQILDRLTRNPNSKN